MAALALLVTFLVVIVLFIMWYCCFRDRMRGRRGGDCFDAFLVCSPAQALPVATAATGQEQYYDGLPIQVVTSLSAPQPSAPPEQPSIAPSTFIAVGPSGGKVISLEELTRERGGGAGKGLGRG